MCAGCAASEWRLLLDAPPALLPSRWKVFSHPALLHTGPLWYCGAVILATTPSRQVSFQPQDVDLPRGRPWPVLGSLPWK